MPDISTSGSLSPFLLAQRVLFDVSAKLVREAEAESHSRRQHGATTTSRVATSLESLINDGNRYGTIYVNPPWPYEQAAQPGSFFWRRPVSLDDLAALPVCRLAAPLSHVHIWSTDMFWRQARQIIEAWGFTYKSTLVWIKPHFSDGDCWGFSHEYLLLGIRGNDFLTDYRPRTWLIETPGSVHPTRKPAVINHLIERISPGPRLQLYEPTQRAGWTSWEGPSPNYTVVDGDVDNDDFISSIDGDDEDDDCDALTSVQQELDIDTPMKVDVCRRAEA